MKKNLLMTTCLVTMALASAVSAEDMQGARGGATAPTAVMPAGVMPTVTDASASVEKMLDISREMDNDDVELGNIIDSKEEQSVRRERLKNFFAAHPEAKERYLHWLKSKEPTADENALNDLERVKRVVAMRRAHAKPGLMPQAVPNANQLPAGTAPGKSGEAPPRTEMPRGGVPGAKQGIPGSKVEQKDHKLLKKKSKKLSEDSGDSEKKSIGKPMIKKEKIKVKGQM